MKILRCTSGRHHDEIFDSYDTGLCNRLLHWEIIQEINKKHNYEFEILVQELQYPELHELIELPNTKLVKENIDDDIKLRNLKFKTVYNIENNSVSLSSPIDKDLLENIIFNNLKLSENDYYSKFGFVVIDDLYHNNYEMLEYRHRKNVQIKDKVLDKSLISFTENMIGIHVRRGRGVWYKENINQIEKSIIEDYIKYREKEAADDFYQFNYIDDKIYFSVINKILEINPTQKIYISYDGPDNLFDHWFTKYPNNLYRKLDFEKYLTQNNIEINLEKNNHYYNIVDLFSLSYCNFLITFPISTWSEFAIYYKDKYVINITDGIHRITNEFKNYIRNKIKIL